LLAAKRISTAISCLTDKTGTDKSDLESLLNISKQFYQDLYASGPSCLTSQSTLLQCLQRTISDDLRQKLERPISEDEVLQAIQSAASNSAPGKDGLPFEFYKAFAPMLAPTLASLFNQSIQAHSLFPAANTAMITLLYKNKGCHKDLKNWCPISLLNCDRKILSKILADRLQEASPHLIHPSQTGFLKGRLIHDNIMHIQLILEQARIAPSLGALVFLDQEKAYDRIAWPYLLACLHKMGFGPIFIQAISSLHQGLCTQVLVNKFASSPFYTQQGLPQGDPLSPLLYNIVIEPFLEFFRLRLHGLTNLPTPFQCLAFTDDVAVGLAHNSDRNTLLQAIALHEKACNAKLNIHKSEFLPLSDQATTSISTIGKTLSRVEPFRYLGAYLHPQCFPLPLNHFNIVLNTLQTTLASWQKRNLSLAGKVLVLNSRLLSKIWYQGYFSTFPPSFYPRLHRLLAAFLWNGKRSQMALKTFFTPKHQGGLGLISPEHHILAQKAWWLHRLSLSAAPPWATLAAQVFQFRYCPHQTGFPSLAILSSHQQLRFKDLWIDIIQAWLCIQGHFPEDIDPLTLSHSSCLHHSSMANMPISTYSISEGSRYLHETDFPLLTHQKWDLPQMHPLPAW